MLTIAPLAEGDIDEIASAFAAIGWNKPAEQYWRYFDECLSDARLVVVARWSGAFAGYGTVVWLSGYPPFREADIPEIVDLNVLPQLRRRGIGSHLLDELERSVSDRARTVGIGVGLTEDYGPAQRLYVLRGYMPDGRGAHAQAGPLRWGDKVVVDDGLVLHLTRALGG
jgi:GNAT superfamily N-acetyltransferase